MTETLDIHVAASVDDVTCRRNNGTHTFSKILTTLVIGYSTSTQQKRGTALRFAGVNVPRGAIITAAYLRLVAVSSNSLTAVNSRLYCEAVDNSTAIADDTTLHSRAANPTTKVDWDNIGAWVATTEYQSPSIVVPIQEVINRAGWVSGNALTVFFEDFEGRSTATTDTQRQFAGYDHTSLTEPILHIEYHVQVNATAFWRRWFGPTAAPGKVQWDGQLKTLGAGAPGKTTTAITEVLTNLEGSAWADDVKRAYFAGWSNPYVLVRFDPATNTYTYYTADTGYDFVSDLCVTGGKVYLGVRGPTATSAYIDVFDTVDGTPVLRARYEYTGLGADAYPRSIATDGTYLFVGTANGKVLLIKIDDNGTPMVLKDTLTLFAAHPINALEYCAADSNIYASVQYYSICKVSYSGDDLVKAAEALTDTGAVADDICFDDSGYLWVGAEVAGGKLFRILRSTFSSFETLYLGPPTYSCNGVFTDSDGVHIWALWKLGIPAQLTRIKTSDLTTQRIWLADSETRCNELVQYDTGKYLVALYITGGAAQKVVNLTNPFLGDVLDKSTVALASGENMIHGSGWDSISGRAYFSTLTDPFKLIRYNPAFPADYSVYTALSGIKDAKGLCIVNGVVYVVHSTSTGLRVSAFNTSSSPPTVSASLSLDGYGGGESIATDGAYLYVGTKGTDNLGYILLIRISDLTLLDDLLMSSSQYIHAIGYCAADGLIYATGQTGLLWKVSRSGSVLTEVAEYAHSEGVITDDLTFDDTYLWLGKEATSPGGQVMRVPRSTFASHEVLTVGPAGAACFGVFSDDDGEHLWAVWSGTPGQLTRYKLSNGFTEQVVLGSGENSANELVQYGSNKYLATCFLSPAKVVRLINPFPSIAMDKPSSGYDYSYWASLRLFVETAPEVSISDLKAYTDGANGLGTGWSALGGVATDYTQPTGEEGISGDVLNTTNYPTLEAAAVNIFGWTSGSPKAIDGSLTTPNTGDIGTAGTDHCFLVIQLRDDSTVAEGLSAIETLTVLHDDGAIEVSQWVQIRGYVVRLTKTFYQAVAGSFTPSGVVGRLSARLISLAGILTSGGIMASIATKVRAVAGALTSGGVLMATAVMKKSLAGTLSSGGSLGIVRVFLKGLAGTLTSSGAAARQAQKGLLGALSPTGIVARMSARLKAMAGTLTSAGALTASGSPQQALSGVLTSIGAVTRATARLKSLAGSFTGIGTIGRISTRLKGLAGTLTSGGALASTAARVKALAGVLSSDGVLIGAATKFQSLAGTLTSNGAVGAIKVFVRSLGGVLTSAGVLLSQPQKVLLGILTSSGMLGRAAAFLKSVAGTLSPTGALTASALKVKALAGVLMSGGNLGSIKVFLRAVSGTLTSSGGLTKQAQKRLVGVFTSGGALGRVSTFLKGVAGSLNPTGALSTAAARLKSVTGVLTSSGVVEAFMGNMLRLSGSFTGTGTVARQVGKALGGVLTSAGSLSRVVGYGVAGVLGFSGGLRRGIAKGLGGVLSAVGNTIRRFLPSGVPDTTIIDLIGSYDNVIELTGSYEPIIELEASYD